VHISLVGINYQTAPIEVREKIAVGKHKLPEALKALAAYLPQSVILSTCNRTEIYAIDENLARAELASLDYFKNRTGLADDTLQQYIYILKNKEAVQHLFRVASGLESMIVGEYEVLGQVRQSLDAAEEAGMVNLALRHIFYMAVRTGRNVREETGISKNALSVSSVAVDQAEAIVGDLKYCKMLVIGAGEAGHLVAKVARERGTSEIAIASRSRDRAENLAETLAATSLDFESLEEELRDTDIVVTCAGAPHRILNPEQIERSMSLRPESPLAIIDIAVPRNVEPEVANIKNVFLYNIDDLTLISEANRKRREESIRLAEETILAEVEKFIANWQDYEVRPLIGALMSKAEKIRSTQLHKTLKSLPVLSAEQTENLESMTKAIVTRILKDPLDYLKKNGTRQQSEIVRDLFQLDTENPA
jgi:glutamyl-tRNA reductase